jgi:hypothetical protein
LEIHDENKNLKYLLLVGGYLETKNLFNEIYLLNIKNFQWEKLNLKLPEILIDYSIFLDEKFNLYLFGGIDFSNDLKNTLFGINIKNFIKNFENIEFYDWMCYNCGCFTNNKCKFFLRIKVEFVKNFLFVILNVKKNRMINIIIVNWKMRVLILKKSKIKKN